MNVNLILTLCVCADNNAFPIKIKFMSRPNLHAHPLPTVQRRQPQTMHNFCIRRNKNTHAHHLQNILPYIHSNPFFFLIDISTHIKCKNIWYKLYKYLPFILCYLCVAAQVLCTFIVALSTFFLQTLKHARTNLRARITMCKIKGRIERESCGRGNIIFITLLRCAFLYVWCTLAIWRHGNSVPTPPSMHIQGYKKK